MTDTLSSRSAPVRIAGTLLVAFVPAMAMSVENAPAESEAKVLDPPAVDEEMVVIVEEDEETSRAVAMRMLDTHLSNSRGRHLYKQHRYAEAAPHLLAAAKRGFKMSQARLGEILVLGLDGIDQDIAAGMGWVGVAASGTTLPSVRNRFNELKAHVPPEMRPRLASIVDAYRAKYGSEATDVNCMRGKADGHFTIMYCRFADEWKYDEYLREKAMGVLEHPWEWPHGRP